MAVTVVPDALPARRPAQHPQPVPSVVAPRPPAPVSLPPAPARASVPVSATLAANEALARRRQAGEPVLPLAFGEAGPARAPRPAGRAGRGHRRQRLRPRGGPPGAARGRRGLLDPARPAHRGRTRWCPGRAASRCCSACCWPWARTWPCRSQAGSATRRRPPWSAPGRTSCRSPPGEGGVCDPAGPGPRRPPGQGGRPADRLGDRHPAGQPHRAACPARHRPRPGRGRGRARPGDHLRRDLPRPGLRHRPADHQPGGLRPRAHGGHHGAEQEPGPGRLADRRGPDARRPPRPGAAGPAARRRQRDLVGAGRPDPGGGRARLQRTARDHRARPPQPPPARRGLPRRGGHVRRRRGGRASAAGGLLHLPGLRPVAGAPGPAARRGSPAPISPGTSSTPTAWGCCPRSAFGERDERPAAAGRHRAAVRGDRARSASARSPRPTRSPSPGSPPRSPAWPTSWPTLPRSSPTAYG